ncbi:MAG: glycosyl transferase family 2 [Verrucomicrobiales bacterium]|nr:glycosyl transferase family 2 [Verrucomicrobiales bacterium]
MPTVTAIIPTYNRAAMLAQALKSALEQTRPPDEIIVVDDGSTDNTAEVVASHGARVRYIRQDNAGAAAARNRGLKESQSEYIAFLDSDDLWTPRKIELQLGFFARTPKADFVFADMANFTGTVMTAEPEIKNPKLHDYLVEHAEHLADLFQWLIIENVVPTPTVMCKRSAVTKVGFFNERLLIAEDLDYWLRAAEVCHWGFLDEVMLFRRRHESNLVSDFTRRNLALIEVLGETQRRPTGHSPKLQRLIAQKINDTHYELGSAFLRTRNYQQARFHLTQVQASSLRKGILAIKRLTAHMMDAIGAGNASA